MNRFESVTKSLMWSMALLMAALVAGCGGGAGGGAPILGSGGAGSGAIAPTVIAVAPLANANDVATNTTIITAQFSEPMAALVPANFTLACTTACAKPPTVTAAVLDATKMIATVTLTNSPLLPLTTYTATVTGATSLATGLALASPYTWNFTTIATPDTTRPSVTFTVPADADTGVAFNSAITAVFSEEMTPATLIIAASTPTSSFRVTCAAPCASPVVGAVTYVVGSRTAVFTPATPLAAGQLYTATITTAATDLAGNLLLSPVTVPVLPQVPNPWTFMTAAADNTAPILNSTVPVDGAINVPVNQTLSATFNETMHTTSVVNAFTLTGPAGPVLLRLVSYDPLTSIATFNPNADLAPGVYTATIANTATDLAGNALVVPPAGGLPVPNPWSFTIPAPIVPPPALAINLRSAASFGIASRAGLTSTGVTVVNGDVALHPLATCTDSTGNAGASQTCLVQPVYASPTGMTVNGSIYWAGDPFDNGGTANAVANDLVIAWTEGMNKVDTLAGVLLGELGAPGPVGKILLPGVYNEANLGFAAGNVATFDALDNPDAIFIIKVGTIGGAGDFTDSGTLLLPTQIKLTRGAQARNIWFVVGRDITIGINTTWNGNILAGRDATVNHSSTVTGRVLAGASGAASGAFVLTGAANPSVTTITVP